MKMKFEESKIEVVSFGEDVITTSGESEEYEGNPDDVINLLPDLFN